MSGTSDAAIRTAVGADLSWILNAPIDRFFSVCAKGGGVTGSERVDLRTAGVQYKF
ncbi:MAG: hypothetical protein ABSF94_07875 [Steroidobacteraceae bacterium]